MKLKKFRMSGMLFADMFKPSLSDVWHRCMKGLPADAKIQSVLHVHGSGDPGDLDVIVESESYPDVSHADSIPYADDFVFMARSLERPAYLIVARDPMMPPSQEQMRRLQQEVELLGPNGVIATQACVDIFQRVNGIWEHVGPSIDGDLGAIGQRLERIEAMLEAASKPLFVVPMPPEMTNEKMRGEASPYMAFPEEPQQAETPEPDPWTNLPSHLKPVDKHYGFALDPAKGACLRCHASLEVILLEHLFPEENKVVLCTRCTNQECRSCVATKLPFHCNPWNYLEALIGHLGDFPPGDPDVSRNVRDVLVTLEDAELSGMADPRARLIAEVQAGVRLKPGSSSVASEASLPEGAIPCRVVDQYPSREKVISMQLASGRYTINQANEEAFSRQFLETPEPDSAPAEPPPSKGYRYGGML